MVCSYVAGLGLGVVIHADDVELTGHVLAIFVFKAEFSYFADDY